MNTQSSRLNGELGWTTRRADAILAGKDVSRSKVMETFDLHGAVTAGCPGCLASLPPGVWRSCPSCGGGCGSTRVRGGGHPAVLTIHGREPRKPSKSVFALIEKVCHA